MKHLLLKAILKFCTNKKLFEKKLLRQCSHFAIFPQYLSNLDVQAEFENLYLDV